MRIEVLVDVKTTLGEGPLWDVDQERLYWIDSFDGRVFRATADGREIRAWDVPAKIGSIAIRRDGNGAICSLANGFHALDFKIFYFADSWSGEIWAYDYDIATGKVANRRTFTRIDTSAGGAADGSTVDSEGFLWNAAVYVSKLVRYAPDGSVDRVIDMPVKKVTSVMFGGPNLDILFVTSMAKPPLPRFPGDGVLRGSLFAIYDLGIRGVPEPRFGA